LNEELDDGRRFALEYDEAGVDDFTFQARSVPVKQAWCDDLRRALKQFG